jgi:hypothetical protein
VKAQSSRCRRLCPSPDAANGQHQERSEMKKNGPMFMIGMALLMLALVGLVLPLV